MLELLFPRRCAGCDAPGTFLCDACRLALSAPPSRAFPPVSPHVPVFAFGPYGGAHRSVVLAMKERDNLAVRKHVGAVLDAGLDYLEARGEIPYGCVLVPAPTRPSSARARGGDPVRACCEATSREVAPVLSLDERTADQSTLDAAGRRRNLAHAVRVTSASGAPVMPGQPLLAGKTCLVVDDVVTTGATLQASVEKLLAHGANIAGCIALCVA